MGHFTCKVYSKMIEVDWNHMYEGCNSKSLTFLIQWDCVSGILLTLYDILI